MSNVTQDRDALMRRLSQVRLVICFVFLSLTISLYAEKPTAWDTVQAFAKMSGHRLTVFCSNGIYHIDLNDSDIAGAGPTMEDAAEDFLSDLNMNTEDDGMKTEAPKNWKKPISPSLVKPESKDWI
jgi:hypothetical protein